MKANKNQVNRLLKTAKGQIDGMLKMIEEDKYCIEISTQILATIAILKRVNMESERKYPIKADKNGMKRENKP